MSNNFKPLSVIHIVSSLEVGGAERFVIDLCQLQRDYVSKVAILSFGVPSDPLIAECKNADISVFHTADGRIKKWLDAIKAIKSFDVIHFHSPYPLKFMLPIMPLCLNKRVIYTRHGAAPFDSQSWVTMHKLAKFFVNKVNFVSQEGADIFSQTHGWESKTKHVIDNGVNLKNISITRKKSEKLRIGSVGRMVTLKNQINLLRAMTLLPQTHLANVEVHFFGDGPQSEQLRTYTQENNLAEQVIFHGMVSDRNDIYNSFDVLTVTSETEGLSLAIMEAMAYMCPILATDVGGNPKLVAHGENGWLFEYNDDAALAEKIKMLVDEPKLMTSFSNHSRQIIEQGFSLANSAEKYRQLYST